MAEDSQTAVISIGDPLIGQEIAGTYQIVRQIGSGGMGSVYEARHVRLPKKFAIKIMHPDIAADSASFERFRREAETTSSLGNAHIAEVVDFNFLGDGAPYMVMEFLEGEDLGSRLDKRKTLPPAQVAGIITDVASALASAHAQGIFHRDIKPANIFLAKQQGDVELVKLLDFGAAKSRSKRNANLTAAGVVVGTPWYMSPEQARGHELDARSDAFSLAVVAYEALSGHLPFEAEDPTQVLFQIVDEPHQPIRAHVPALSERVEDVFSMALAKEVGDRYTGVSDFASDLRHALGVAPPSSARRAASTVTETQVITDVAARLKSATATDVERAPQPESHDTPPDALAAAARAVPAGAERPPAATEGRGGSVRTAWIAGAVGALLVLGVVGALLLSSDKAPPLPPMAPSAPPKALLPPHLQLTGKTSGADAPTGDTGGTPRAPTPAEPASKKAHSAKGGAKKEKSTKFGNDIILSL